MDILYLSLIAVVLIFLGYYYVCCYYRGCSLRTFNKDCISISKNRLAYLFISFISAGLLIYFSVYIYGYYFLKSMTLLCLILIIVPIAAIDHRMYKIPNVLLLVAIGVRIVIFVLEALQSYSDMIISLKDCAAGSLVIGCFFMLLFLVFINGLGMGDVKLFVVIAFYLGLWPSLSAVFFSLMASFVLSVFLLITKKKKRSDMIAFAPSVLAGVLVSLIVSGM